MPLNKRRKYSDIKWFNDCCANALHEPTEKLIEEAGAVIRCGGERDFIKEDPQEKRRLITERNSRTLDKYYNQAKKTEGFVAMMERLNKISLKRPEESNENG